MSLCCICMLCKKQTAQPARNPDELPPLHEPEEITHDDGKSTKNYFPVKKSKFWTKIDNFSQKYRP